MRDSGFADGAALLLGRAGRFCAFDSKASFSGRSLCCGSAHRGANVSDLNKPLTASESPLTSLRGCAPKPPPCNPFLIGGGTRYFSGSVKADCERCTCSARSTPQRTHKRRDRSTPEAAADSGCNTFDTSTQAQTFPASVI